MNINKTFLVLLSLFFLNTAFGYDVQFFCKSKDIVSEDRFEASGRMDIDGDEVHAYFDSLVFNFSNFEKSSVSTVGVREGQGKMRVPQINGTYWIAIDLSFDSPKIEKAFLRFPPDNNYENPNDVSKLLRSNDNRVFESYCYLIH